METESRESNESRRNPNPEIEIWEIEIEIKPYVSVLFLFGNKPFYRQPIYLYVYCRIVINKYTCLLSDFVCLFGCLFGIQFRIKVLNRFWLYVCMCVFVCMYDYPSADLSFFFFSFCQNSCYSRERTWSSSIFCRSDFSWWYWQGYQVLYGNVIIHVLIYSGRWYNI